MDLMAVDVTHHVGVKEGVLVTLLGGQGRVQLGAAQLARFAGTIPYEILCGLSDRVPRVYLD
jgi:alanine racemase